MNLRPIIIAALIAALLGSAAQAQTYTDPSGKTQPAPGLRGETPSGGQPMAVPPTLPDVPPTLPSIYSQKPPPGLPPPPSGAPASPGQFAPQPNQGPVTGYGPGGMAPAPGAPANPPYSYGGASGRPN